MKIQTEAHPAHHIMCLTDVEAAFESLDNWLFKLVLGGVDPYDPDSNFIDSYIVESVNITKEHETYLILRGFSENMMMSDFINLAREMKDEIS